MALLITNEMNNLALNESSIPVSEEYLENSAFGSTINDYIKRFYGCYIDQGYKFEGTFARKVINEGGFGKHPNLNRIEKIFIKGCLIKNNKE